MDRCIRIEFLIADRYSIMEISFAAIVRYKWRILAKIMGRDGSR